MGNKLAYVVVGILLTGSCFAAVEVTCVCSRYELDSNKKLVVAVKELYRTTQWSEVEKCTDAKVTDDSRFGKRSIVNRYFNCIPVGKEDLK